MSCHKPRYLVTPAPLPTSPAALHDDALTLLRGVFEQSHQSHELAARTLGRIYGANALSLEET